MLPAHIREVAEPVGVRGAVVVEASPWVEDNQWIIDLVATEPYICAVVGNFDCEAENFPKLLERFARYPVFRGIRIRQPRPATFDHPRLRPNLALLAAARCVLDVAMRGSELARLAEIARELPGLRILIDHLAFVPIDGASPEPTWHNLMRSFTDLPNIFCKVSRFTEQAATQPAPLETKYYESIFDAVWGIFGPDRLIFGSNWPPCLNASDYCATVTLAKDYFRGKGVGVVAKVMARNAAAFYGGPRFTV